MGQFRLVLAVLRLRLELLDIRQELHDILDQFIPPGVDVTVSILVSTIQIQGSLEV